MRYLLKNCKNRPALGAPTTDPYRIPLLRIPGYATVPRSPFVINHQLCLLTSTSGGKEQRWLIVVTTKQSQLATK